MYPHNKHEISSSSPHKCVAGSAFIVSLMCVNICVRLHVLKLLLFIAFVGMYVSGHDDDDGSYDVELWVAVVVVLLFLLLLVACVCLIATFTNKNVHAQCWGFPYVMLCRAFNK